MELTPQDLIYMYGQKSVELEVTIKQFNDLKEKCSDPVWLTNQIQHLAKLKKEQENKSKLKDVSKDGKTD